MDLSPLSTDYDCDSEGSSEEDSNCDLSSNSGTENSNNSFSLLKQLLVSESCPLTEPEDELLGRVIRGIPTTYIPTSSFSRLKVSLHSPQGSPSKNILLCHKLSYKQWD